MRTRNPSAWGFHPFEKDEEKKEIERCFLSKHGAGATTKGSGEGERRILGAVVPHAGYVYSGPVASHTYYRLAEDGNPETFVILGPNHAGYPGFSAMTEGVWRMPMGDVCVDSELAGAIVVGSQFVDVNPDAHDREHSIEVQLPFLQYIYNSDFKIVPITVGYCDYGMCEDVGASIAQAAREKKKDVVVIGSTDFTHYGPLYGYTPVGMEPLKKVLKWIHDVDDSLITLITALEAKKLAQSVSEKKLTMCGSLPVATMILASKELGAKSGRLLKYTTSYDVQGSTDAIVGYAAVELSK